MVSAKMNFGDKLPFHLLAVCAGKVCLSSLYFSLLIYKIITTLFHRYQNVWHIVVTHCLCPSNLILTLFIKVYYLKMPVSFFLFFFRQFCTTTDLFWKIITPHQLGICIFLAKNTTSFLILIMWNSSAFVF